MHTDKLTATAIEGGLLMNSGNESTFKRLAYNKQQKAIRLSGVDLWLK